MRRYWRAIGIVFRDLIVNVLAASVVIPGPLRRVILRAYGIGCRTSKVSPRCFFGGRNISIGRGSFLNYGCFLDGYAPIEIGEQVFFGPQVMLITSSHRIGDASERGGAKYGEAIRIGSGSWLGGRVTVMPGVTIGPGCIVAAGSIVTRDCEPNGLYAGVPAVRKKTLP